MLECNRQWEEVKLKGIYLKRYTIVMYKNISLASILKVNAEEKALAKAVCRYNYFLVSRARIYSSIRSEFMKCKCGIYPFGED